MLQPKFLASPLPTDAGQFSDHTLCLLELAFAAALRSHAQDAGCRVGESVSLALRALGMPMDLVRGSPGVALPEAHG